MGIEQTHKLVDVYGHTEDDVFTGSLEGCRSRARELASRRVSWNDGFGPELPIYICLADGKIVERVW